MFVIVIIKRKIFRWKFSHSSEVDGKILDNEDIIRDVAAETDRPRQTVASRDFPLSNNILALQRS